MYHTRTIGLLWKIEGSLTTKCARAPLCYVVVFHSGLRFSIWGFVWDNMAAAAGRYYNEGGRATKRQKTEDGMTTVSIDSRLRWEGKVHASVKQK